MPTLATRSGAVTLLDWSKSIDPDGKVAAVAELLTQSNEILMDMPFIEGNLPTGHRAAIRTGLPSVIWRQLYQGVPAGKSLRAQVEDSLGILETRSEVDLDVASLNGNTAEFRLSEAQAFLESMNQAMAEALIYGNSAINPEQFTGLAPRYSSTTVSPSNQTANNVISAGGSGNCTSVWLVCWGQNTVTGIFPKGSNAGLVHQDLGEIDAFDGSNNRYRAYADRWQWKAGLHVKDWRYIVRICNISVSDLQGQSGTQALTAATQIHRVMARALQRIPFMGMGKCVFYANRTVKTYFSVAALDRSNAAVTVEPALEQFGKLSPGSVSGGGTLKFLGVPIRTVDRIRNNETALV